MRMRPRELPAETTGEEGTPLFSYRWSGAVLISLVIGWGWWLIVWSGDSEPAEVSGSVNLPGRDELAELSRRAAGGDRAGGTGERSASAALDGGQVGWCLGLDGGGGLVSGSRHGLSLSTGDARSSTVVWRLPPDVLGGPPGWPASDDHLVVVGTANGRVIGIDPRSGATLWAVADAGGRQRPWLADGLLLHHDGESVVRLDPASGEELWRSESDPFRRIVGSVVHEDGKVFAARNRMQNERFVRATVDVVSVLDVETGAALAELEVLDPLRVGNPSLLDVAVADGELLTLELGGALVGRGMNATVPKWRWPVADSVTAVSASAEGVAVLTADGWQSVLGDDPAAVVASVSREMGEPCRLPAEQRREIPSS